MKIKSLLLGSAAAMVAVSAANAADIVIPEPEMVEYVRVCDAAGDGYFYIPGGETCLKISGYAQYELNFDNDNDGGIVIGIDDVDAFGDLIIADIGHLIADADIYDYARDGQWSQEEWIRDRRYDLVDESDLIALAEALNIDVDTDDIDDETIEAIVSELADRDIDVASGRGTSDAKYEARIQFDAWRDTQYGALQTRIRLTAGKEALAGDSSDALEVDRAYFDLAGLRVGVDASAWDYGFGGPADAYNVGGDAGGTVRYTAALGTGSFTLSLEEDSFADDFVPSIVGLAAFTFGDVQATLGAVYEDDSTEIGRAIESLLGNLDGVGAAWSVKGTARYDLGAGSVGAGFQYSSAPVHAVLGVSSYLADYEWVLGADAAFDATENLELGLGFQYGIDEGLTSDNDWTIGALASYDITETLNTNLRLRYNDDDEWSARLRFRSSF